MMVLLALVAYHDGWLRVPQQLRTPDESSRSRWFLPRPHWLHQLLQESSGHHLLRCAPRVSKPRGAAGELFSPCLAWATQGHAFAGPLTQWNQQDWLLWEHYREPQDAFSLKLQRVVRVFPSLTIPSSGTRDRGQYMRPFLCESPVQLGSRRLFCAGHWDAPATGRGAAAQLDLAQAEDFLQSPLDLDNLLSNAVCVWLPAPIVHLIAEGVWDSLVLCSSWTVATQSQLRTLLPAPICCPHLPALASRSSPELSMQHGQHTAQRQSHQQQAMPLTREAAAEVAGLLRKWAPAILAAADNQQDDLCQTKLELERAVTQLDTFASPRTSTTSRYDAVAITKTLLIAALLRNRGNVKAAVMRGIQAVFPDQSPEYLENLVGDCPIPHRSTVGRHLVQVDAALCCHWRQRLIQSDDVVYLWADSSPQGGVDWLLSIVQLIKASDLEACAQAARYLCASVDEFERAVQQDDDDLQEHIARERHRCGDLLRSSVVWHRQIPTGLGSGCSTVDHKCKCIVHKFLVETQSVEHLTDVMSRVRAVCVDMGTEMGVADIACQSREYLPPWMAEPGLEADCDIVPLQQTTTTSADSFMMPQALLSPGMAHIFNNLVLDVDTALPWYPKWLEGFRCLVHLLHTDHLRQRFVAKCVLGTPFAVAAHRFERGVPSSAKWRWGTVVNVLDRVLPLRHVLQATWNPTRFLGEHFTAQRPDSHDAADAQHSLLDTRQLTETIRSNMWWSYSEMLQLVNTVSSQLLSWVEGCSCHGWLQKQHNTRQITSTAKQLDLHRAVLNLPPGVGDGSAFGPCPMAGKRAPELARGFLQTEFAALCETLHLQVLHSCAGLSDAEVQTVLSEFEQGKTHMAATLQQKTQFWQRLPWRLAALADSDETRAQQLARQILQEFDAPAGYVL